MIYLHIQLKNNSIFLQTRANQIFSYKYLLYYMSMYVHFRHYYSMF